MRYQQRLFHRKVLCRLIPGFLRGDQGISAISFAILAPVLITAFIAVIELGVALVIQNALEGAVREAARFGIVESPQNGDREAAIEDKIIEVATKLSGGIIDPDKLSINVEAYSEIQNVDRPEPFDDLNENGIYDEGEPYIDVNGNSQWDADQGVAGSYGGQSQVVQYKVMYPFDTHIPFLSAEDRQIVLVGRTTVVNEEFSGG